MTLIDGKAISEQVKQEIAAEVAEIVARGMIDVAMLRKIRSDLERIATRNSQRIEIEPFRFSFAYDGETFCYCPSHIISHSG